MMHQTADGRVPGWDGNERRGIDGITLKLMAEVRAAMDKHEKDEHVVFTEIKEMIKEKDEASEQRHRDLGARFDAMQQSTSSLLFENNKTTAEIHKLFKAAFPDGDAESHRKAHENWIAKDKADREFWFDVKKKAVGAVVTAVLLWVGVVLWAALVKGPTP